MYVNSAAVTTDGFWTNAYNYAGTPVLHTRTYDATNLLPNIMYTTFTTAAATNSGVAIYFSLASRGAMCGNNTYGAGSKVIIIFGLPIYASTQRMFAGYAGSNNQLGTTVNTSTNLNIVGVGKDSGDTNLQIMFNGGSGTATKVDTGIAANANDVYRVTVFLPSNTTTTYVTLEKFTKSGVTTFSSSNSAKAPVAGTMMYFNLSSNTGTGAASVALAAIQAVEEMY